MIKQVKSTKTIFKAFKTLLIPAAAAIGAADTHNLGPHCHKTTSCNCKPSQLPIYPESCPGCKLEIKSDAGVGEVEKAIGKVRSEIWHVGNSVSGYKQQVREFFETGLAHTQSSVDFLQEESNGPERAGAIGVASLSGLIFGLRGGIIRRLTYATIGGLSMASVCYPREAAEYSEIAVQEGNRYFVAGYHFLFGDTPKLPEWAETVLGDTKQKVKEITSKSS